MVFAARMVDAEPGTHHGGFERRLRECREFFAMPELSHLPATRLRQALYELYATGTYTHTAEELLIGAKVAWRNHARCVGRQHWRTLKLLDARHATTAEQIATACWKHLRIATNGGALQSVIPVGPPPRADGREYRIDNPQLIRYAGYRQTDGSILGDPAHLEITETAPELGWRGSGTAFDVLPLLVSTPDEPLRHFPVPPELVLEVDITHPDYPWFGELDLKWHAVPAVSNMDLSIGGVIYPCAPFSGWYVNTEIGARNLCDEDRYNMLPAIAAELGLDTSSARTLWKDRALVELNRAVIHSFRTAKVIMVDHHTVANQFIDHVEREAREGRPCPTDWSWINPPMSAALTPTYHRLFDRPDPTVRPNFIPRAPGAGCPASGTT
ncbi:Nitric oxide synthase, endothelial (plasmid) [Rhodococcus opacus]|uniref:Nitric oxide synthase, endothelial n=2 Tax=Rhodococcus opacus TaxID=37919 RepID=A0A1B1KIN6_RHOOP|nr:Nitric oxide synthase, endothelial [Rhodococcus opacus]